MNLRLSFPANLRAELAGESLLASRQPKPLSERLLLDNLSHFFERCAFVGNRKQVLVGSAH